MSENWDDYAESWDENKDVIHYSNHAFEALLNIRSPKGLTVLDFGCGTGLLTEKLSEHGAMVTALDSSEKMTEILSNKALKRVTVISAELSSEYIKSNPDLLAHFDLIVASSVCAFLPNFDSTLKLLVSLLKPGGLFVQWDWAKTPDEPDFGFTPTMIQKAYRKTNLTVLKAENTFTMGTPTNLMQVVMGVGKN